MHIFKRYKLSYTNPTDPNKKLPQLTILKSERTTSYFYISLMLVYWIVAWWLFSIDQCVASLSLFLVTLSPILAYFIVWLLREIIWLFFQRKYKKKSLFIIVLIITLCALFWFFKQCMIPNESLLLGHDFQLNSNSAVYSKVHELLPKYNLPTYDKTFIYVLIPTFLTISLSGFLGMLLYGIIIPKIDRSVKENILADIKRSHLLKLKNKEPHNQNDNAQDNNDSIKNEFKFKERYNTDEMFLNISEHFKTLNRSVNNQDTVSKSISRQSKRLKRSIEKIEILKENRFIKTGRLRFISNYMRELTDYAKQLNIHSSKQVASEKDIQIVEEHRNIINEIEAKISLGRAHSLFRFFSIPSVIFLLLNLTLYRFSDGELPIPLSLDAMIVTCLLILPTGYFGYSLFKFISVHRSIPMITGWRQNSTRVEDGIAKVFELISFFIATSILLLAYYYLVGGADLFFRLPDSEKRFFYTIISSFLPLEAFSSGLENYSELLKNDVANGFRIVIRFLSVILTTTLFLMVVKFLTKKYQRYSYDEHSYNAFLPPELLKIFGFFIIFIISSAMIYSLILAEIKGVQQKKKDTPSVEISVYKNCTEICELKNNKQDDYKQCVADNCLSTLQYSKKDSGKSIAKPAVSSFGFTDFLPYTIFLGIVGTVFGISTRELLENYFSGISQRVDASFEEDDMVSIDDSPIMQVKNIGFKNVTFFDITQNAFRYIPFKQLDNQKIINFTEPTLHFRRNIDLFVAKEQTSNTSNYLLANKPATKRAEMLLMLSAFYVRGVKLPKIKSHKPVHEYEVKRSLITQSKDSTFKVDESELKNIVKSIKDLTTEIYEENYKDCYGKIFENKKDYNNEVYDSKKYDSDSDKLEFDLSLKSIDEISHNITTDGKQELKKTEESIKKLVIEVELGIDIAKALKEYVNYLCKINNAYISYKNSSSIYGEAEFINKAEKDDKELEKINKANNFYRQLLLILADKAVEISYLYYDIALQLWDVKESDNISKNETRSIDIALLELLNIPRVTSENQNTHDPIMWKMQLEVTLQLAEQSDEIVHHINSFIDNHYVLFMGKKDSTPTTNNTKKSSCISLLSNQLHK